MAHPNLHAKSSAKKFGGKPEDYIVLFTIYFSLKVADQLADRVAKKLSKNFLNGVCVVYF